MPPPAREMGRALRRSFPARVLSGHRFTIGAAVIGVIVFAVLPGRHGNAARAVLAWDFALTALLVMLASMLIGADCDRMVENASAQEEGEWTVFFATLAGVVVSFAAITRVMSIAKDMPIGFERRFYIGVVGVTLFLSWLMTHVLFGLRYAHEYYQRNEATAPKVDGGLSFPSEDMPDYSDFMYFSIVLGMTFQVSDVQITSRKLRRLAAVHGLVGFLFNTVIIALTVNIASSLL